MAAGLMVFRATAVAGRRYNNAAMDRTLEPELLDSLPPDHPDALHNRRDLWLTNFVLGNHRWFARTLPRVLRADERALEIGAGTGELGRQLHRAGIALDGLDLWPRPADWPGARAWHVADLRAFPGYGAYAAVLGNLIFHQFSPDELAQLGAELQRHARVIVAAEPARRRMSQILFRTLAPLLGANRVSLHDAHVSIAAGFRGDELPRALGLAPREWNVRISATVLGVYRMIAVRREAEAGRRFSPPSASPREQRALLPMKRTRRAEAAPCSALRPIEIIGGGLAGLSLGLALRRAGVPVAVFEAGDYPRHRVCGEFITGLGASTIARLGLDALLADALVHREAAWFHRPDRVKIERLPSPALGLSRHALDARLAQAFRAAGGELRTRTRVTDLAPAPGRVFAHGRRRGKSRWLGLKVHALDLPLVRELELHLGNRAYVGLSRIEGGAVNICGLFQRREPAVRGPALLFAYLRACGLTTLAARIEAATVDATSFCAVAALSFDRTTRQPREGIQLGDACAMIPPFTGNGMAMAFQSAEAALDPLIAFARGERTWAETCRATESVLRGQFRLRLASAHALHPFLLQSRPQRWFAALHRTRLLPFRPLYAALH